MSIALRGFGIACLAVCVSVGCRSAAPDAETVKGVSPFATLPNPMQWGVDPDEPRSGEPDRIVATWVDTVRQTPGEASERGFGGRLYFYDRRTDPIAVEGRLVVYAFDEGGRLATDHKPTRRFVFPVEQLTKHMSVSELGPSYSVWLPWGPSDGPPADISLIARFEPVRGGGLVVSDQTRQRLPGSGLAPAEGTMLAATPASQQVRQAGFQEPPAAAPRGVETVEAVESRKRLSTTTIRLNR
ncbi:hypothetical protein Pla108_27190 [Botrimarina colliarenosi]|uniref:Lipoprotein n=1 Tax=Botrimarina colliarenosi TaxID=2528001 RepID=A0A5C6AA87_9BACT|nr:hypothetical protein [Botrimarina colliarenosi]TWT96942.1 hypothetical protein Pla108_27190 [Botrimarina colliarenosi]